MTTGIEGFNELRADSAFPAHYLTFEDGGRPPMDVLEAIHGVLKDVRDERYRQGIVDAEIAHEADGTAIRAIVDHSPSPSETYRLKKSHIKFVELPPAA